MEAKNNKTPIVSLCMLNSKESSKNSSSKVSSIYITSKKFIMKKENQRKIVKVIGTISSSVILSGYLFKVVPLLTPNLTKAISGQLTAMFPNIIQNVNIIPKKHLIKISSNLCILSGIASSLLGKDIPSGSVNAYRSLSPKDLL